jgi:uncharacterized peroxidase-related enzyme
MSAALIPRDQLLLANFRHSGEPIMSRLTQLAPENASGPAGPLFAAVKAKLGKVPNMLRAMGNSPAALSAYLQFSGSLGEGRLSPQQREQIALAVGQANHCDYCLAAHSTIGKMVGLNANQIRDARLGTDADPKTAALLRLATQIVQNRGFVADTDLQAARDQGFTDGDIAEVVANVALNLFTNYFNHVADTDIDFPEAAKLNSMAD